MRRIRTLLITFAALAFAAGALQAGQAADAQAARVDDRWQAWLGCWQLLEETVRDADDPYAAPEFTPVAGAAVCVTPGARPEMVTLSTEVDAQALLTDTIVADGAQHPVDEPGCTGWRRVQWSASGLRLFARAESACADGVRRVVSGLTTIAPGPMWVDVQVEERGGRESIQIRKYRRLPDRHRALRTLSIDELARAASAAMRQAVPFTLAEIPEAAAALQPSAVEAALVETGAGFPMTAQRILELSDAGVPGRVIDLMVALSFPRHFVIERRAGPQPASGRGRLAGGIGGSGWYDAYGFPYYYAPFGYGWNSYDSFYYGAPVSYSGPVDQPQPSGRGRVIDGLGYTRVRTRDPIGFGTAGGGGISGGGDGGSSSGGGVTSQGYSGGGGDTGRTAVSRPPGA